MICGVVCRSSHQTYRQGISIAMTRSHRRAQLHKFTSRLNRTEHDRGAISLPSADCDGPQPVGKCNHESPEISSLRPTRVKPTTRNPRNVKSRLFRVQPIVRVSVPAVAAKRSNPVGGAANVNNDTGWGFERTEKKIHDSKELRLVQSRPVCGAMRRS